MSLSGTPWELPSARAFLGEMHGFADTGGGIVCGGPSMPSGSAAAVAGFLRSRGYVAEIIAALPGLPPSAALSAALGCPADLKSVACDPGFAEHAVIVEPGAEAAEWLVYMSRFEKARSGRETGLALVLLFPDLRDVESAARKLSWNGRLRRIDVTVWADLNEPSRGRTEPLATLASSLAVELGGWNLDLAADVARSSREDLLNPRDILARWGDRIVRETDGLDGEEVACTASLVADGLSKEVDHRIWKAQLRALFPWIEEIRQKVIERHRGLLSVPEIARRIGATQVEDLEFGSIHFQIRDRVAPAEAGVLECFVRLRNDLAHRKPVRRDDLDKALREHGRLA